MHASKITSVDSMALFSGVPVLFEAVLTTVFLADYFS